MTFLERIVLLYLSIASQINLIKRRTTKGTVLIDFGVGSLRTSTDVSHPLIDSTDVVSCWISGESTLAHNTEEQVIEDIKVVVGNKTTGVGFTIYAAPARNFRLFGQYSVSYIIHKT